MFTYPQTWRPINFTWYQGNENFCCYATRLVGENFKIEFFTLNGTLLSTTFLSGSIFDAMNFYTKQKYLRDLLQED